MEAGTLTLLFGAGLGAGFIDRVHYIKHWNDSMIDAVNVYAQDRASVGALATNLRKRLGGQSVFVTTTADLRERFIDFFVMVLSRVLLAEPAS